MGDEVVHIVRGREIVRFDGRMLREQARAASRVVVDVGAGDGRWILGLRNREGRVCVRLNASVVDDPLALRRLNLPLAGTQDLEARLRAGYGALGVHLDVRRAALDPETSWGRRLAAGRPLPVLALDGRAHPGNAEAPAGVKMV